MTISVVKAVLSFKEPAAPAVEEEAVVEEQSEEDAAEAAAKAEAERLAARSPEITVWL